VVGASASGCSHSAWGRQAARRTSLRAA
jgi:hypothetical protein